VYLSYPNFKLFKKLNINLFFISLAIAFSFSTYVTADIILDRKLGFRSNKLALRAITSSVKQKDFDQIIEKSNIILHWSKLIERHFPEGSHIGDTHADVGVWTDPESFKQRIYENSEATKSLILAAKSKDIFKIK
jgi:cytochrome c556